MRPEVTSLSFHATGVPTNPDVWEISQCDRCMLVQTRGQSIKQNQVDAFHPTLEILANSMEKLSSSAGPRWQKAGKVGFQLGFICLGNP